MTNIEFFHTDPTDNSNTHVFLCDILTRDCLQNQKNVTISV